MRKIIDSRSGSAQGRASCQAERPFLQSAGRGSAEVGFGRRTHALTGASRSHALTLDTGHSQFISVEVWFFLGNACSADRVSK